jgi:hypothetical protein
VRKSDVGDTELAAYLESALLSERGIEIRTNHMEYLRRRLYVAKRKDTRFRAIKISTSPTEKGCLWLMKEVEDEGA